MLHRGESWRLQSGRKVFPPALTTLKLLDCTIRIPTETSVLELPRSITTLALRTKALLVFTKYCWPPQLQSFELDTGNNPVVLEHLPRTVTHLAVKSLAVARTHYTDGRGDGEFIFPFRCFFPFLSSLILNIKVPGDIEPLFRSIVSPTACNTALVEEFISNKFWSLPGLEYVAHRSYPLLRHLETSKNTISSSMVSEMRSLTPYFTELGFLDSFQQPSLPTEILRCLPSLATYKTLGTSIAQLSDLLCLPKLTRLAVLSIPIAIAKSFTSLEHLRAVQLKADENSIHEVPWPSTLRTLHIDCTYPNGLLPTSLPSYLTYLDIYMRSGDEWSAAVTSLFCLETLKIMLSAPGEWMQCDQLAAVASIRLRSLYLYFASSLEHPTSKPFLDEFLGSTSTLPPSLTHLDIAVAVRSGVLIPLTVIPSLPRQLRSLSLSTLIVWSSSQYTVDASVVDMSPAELLSSLPPQLEKLYLWQRYGTPFVSYKLLGCLPKSLTSYVQHGRGLFSGPVEHSLWEAVMPRNVIELEIRYEIEEDDTNRARVKALLERDGDAS